MANIETLQSVAVNLARLVNIVYKMIKGDLMSAFGLLKVIADFKGVDLVEFKAELLNSDHDGRLLVEQTFDAAISITDPVVAQKVIDAADALELTTELLESAMGLFSQGVVIVNKFKLLLGV